MSKVLQTQAFINGQETLTLMSPAQFANCLYSSKPFRMATSQSPNFSLYSKSSWLRVSMDQNNMKRVGYSKHGGPGFKDH